MVKKTKIINFEEAKAIQLFTQEIKNYSLEKLIKETKKLELEIELKFTKQLLTKAKTILKELEKRSSINIKNRLNHFSKME